jgi:competence protein ComEC
MTEITVWDVQHGSATYVKSPNGKHIIIDAGMGSYENGTDFSPLDHLRSNYGVKRINYAILTHPHGDHIEDIDNLIDLYPKVLRRPKHLTRGDIITTKTKKSDIPLYEKYIEFSDGYDGNVSGTADDPANPDNFEGLSIQAFGAINCSASNLNNQSILSVFSYADSKVVIAGDNENASFNELLQHTNFKAAIKNADILVASHHGRESGFHKEFVELVKPHLTVISDGSKTDTSAVDDYGRISDGWTVSSRKRGSSEVRKTVSTYHDGVINIKFGYNKNNEPFLIVKIK